MLSSEFRALCFTLAIVLTGLFGFRVCLSRQARPALEPRIFVYVALLYTVSFLSPSVQILRVFLVLAPAFTARSRMEAVGVYLLSLPLVPLLAAEQTVGSIYLFNVTTAHMMALGLALAVAVRPGLMGPVASRYHLLFWTFLIVVGFVQARGGPPTGYLRSAVDLPLSYGLPFYIIGRVLSPGKQTERAIIPFMASGFALALSTLFEVRRNWALFQEIYVHFDISVGESGGILRMRGGLFRSHGPFLESTSFGLFLMVVLIAVLAYPQVFRTRVRAAAAVGLVACGLMLTQARGDWVGAIVGVLLLYYYRGRVVQFFSFIAFGAISGLLVYLAALTSHRLAESIGLREDATGDYRRQLFWEGVSQVKSHPLIGQGQKSLEINMAKLIQGQHIVDFVNTHLYFAMTAGAVGLCIWLAYILAGPQELFSVRGRALRERRDLSSASFAFGSLFALAVALTFTSTYERNLHWVMIMVAVSAAAAATLRRAAPRRTPAEPAGYVEPPPSPARLTSVQPHASPA